MNKFKFYFILSLVATVFFSCSDDTVEDIYVEPLRDFVVQFDADKALMEDFLKNHYIKFNADNVKFTDPDFADKEYVFEKITDRSTQTPLFDYLNSTNTFPKLIKHVFYVSNKEQYMYCLVLREGTGESPSNVDGVYVNYVGELLKETANGKIFESSTNYERLYNLDGTGSSGGIRGWSEFFPYLKTGTPKENADGTFSFSNYGVGAMILPSVLGYYDKSRASANGVNIEAYSPLVFKAKLLGVKRYDHDGDGIYSYLEDSGNSHVYSNPGFFANGTVNPDDTDGDGLPDFLDADDDGDGILTKTEIGKTINTRVAFDAITDCNGNVTKNRKEKIHLVKCPKK